ncbi:MAG: tetratricopeptide repeat protein [Acidobacteriota bacterium]
MNRDNVLFLVIGVLVGFIAGYVAHEMMLERQPRRLVPGQETVNVAQPPGASGALASPQANDPQAAMDRVQRLAAYVRDNPNDVQAVRTLGDLNFDIGNWSRAIELYEQTDSLTPNEPDVLTNLGVAYRNAGRLDDAIESLRRARELDASHWQSRFNSVLVLAIDLERYDEAQPVLDELVALQPDNTDVQRLAEEVASRR